VNLVRVFMSCNVQQANLYRIMVNESAKEYAYFKYGLSNLQFVDADMDNGAVCPACPTVCISVVAFHFFTIAG
jgi:hypothetical protein